MEDVMLSHPNVDGPRPSTWAVALVLFVVLAFPTSALAEQVQEVSAVRLQQLCREAVEEVLPEGLELSEVRWSQTVRLPRGEVAATAHLESDEPVRGRLRTRLELLVDGEAVRVLRVQLQVRDRRLVVVATRQLRPGDVIRADDIELRELPPGVYVRRPAREAEGVVGQVATRLTDAGEVLEMGSVRPPALVLRRQRIRIIARAGGVVVVAQGEALEEGAHGATIRVRRLTGRRTLEARVTGPGEVEVL